MTADVTQVIAYQVHCPDCQWASPLLDGEDVADVVADEHDADHHPEVTCCGTCGHANVVEGHQCIGCRESEARHDEWWAEA